MANPHLLLPTIVRVRIQPPSSSVPTVREKVVRFIDKRDKHKLPLNQPQMPQVQRAFSLRGELWWMMMMINFGDVLLGKRNCNLPRIGHKETNHANGASYAIHARPVARTVSKGDTGLSGAIDRFTVMVRLLRQLKSSRLIAKVGHFKPRFP